MKEYLERRIKELREADAKFCNDRWDETKYPLVRKMARENSNSVTLARQELERALKELNKKDTSNRGVLIDFAEVYQNCHLDDTVENTVDWYLRSY